MAAIKDLAGQTVLYGAPTIVGRLLNYLLVPLHTYLFAPEQYGIVSELYAWVSLFMVILTYGMETAFFRFSQIEEYKKKCFSTVALSLLTSSLIFIVLSTTFSKQIAVGLDYPNNPEYVTWLSIIIAIDAFTSIFFASLRLQMRPLRFAFVKIVNILTSIILNLFFLLLCPYLLQENIAPGFVSAIYNPEIGVGYIFVANLVASIVTLCVLLPELFKVKISFDKELWKQMMAYGLPLMIFGLAGIVNETMDRILLRRLSPPEVAQANVGIYSACYKISIMMTLFIQAFKYAAEPYFFNKAKDADAKQTYSDVMSIFVMVCSLIFLGIMLYMDIVQYFVGESYRVGLHIVPILLLANLFLGIFYNLSIWYKLTDRTKAGAYISIMGAAITLILNIILIPILGYTGSAWATFACYFAMVVVSYLFGQKYYYVDYKVWRIILYILYAVAIYLFSTLFHFESLIWKLIFHTVLIIFYAITLFLIDKKYILTIIKR
ncbi:oligosaccharide flippase family protein [Bacteroidales bacterium OttesenSCG-928-B11]|nr:oligosaccharide flippase family protein [Bacteroidales bacterium OttesenSCG-928-E04]MDL2311258.1 oligosaccharide flippase family protein [Bacteroidales bacterium OttesenSCG-928-B11]